MLDSARARIEEQVAPDALVLDVGGGASPLARADWVIDLIAYSERASYGVEPDPVVERFGPHTWVQTDICDRTPWPFEDGQFDFAVCAHTLEDIRDPIWVCSELIRVAQAGYIEVPSRLEEQTYGFQGPWTGWGHHRWLIDHDADGLTFVFKHHVVNRQGDHFPAGFRDTLSPEQRVLQLWWEGGFGYRERVFFDGPSLDAYLRQPLQRDRRPWRRGGRGGG